MKSYKLLIAVCAVLTFGLLTACGQGFKSSALEASKDPGKAIDNGRAGAPAGTTPVDVDQDVADQYASRMGDSDALADKIVGIDVTLTVESGEGTEDEEYFAAAHILMAERRLIPGDTNDCFVNSREFEIGQPGVTASTLRSMEAVELGSSSGVTAIAHCTKEDCSEMVLAVREGNNTALYGMRRTSIGREVGGTVHRYMSRSVAENLDGFYQNVNFFIGFTNVTACEAKLSSYVDTIGDDLDDAFEDPRDLVPTEIPGFIGVGDSL